MEKEKEKIIGQMKKEVDESQHKFDPYEDIRSNSEGEVKEYAKTEKPQSYRSVTTPPETLRDSAPEEATWRVQSLENDFANCRNIEGTVVSSCCQ